MKPYIVESIEHEGRVTREFKPQILNGSICSKATADTLTRALKMVTLEGTASRLKNAKCTVAGKTGTSRVHLDKEEQAGSGNPYADIHGRKKHQATFVGFFPAALPDLQRGIAPLGPPSHGVGLVFPATAPGLGRGVGPPGRRPWPRA